MDKCQFIHNFWNSFGIQAYDENTVPADASIPRITYSVITSDFDRPVELDASIWDRSTSWQAISKKADEIAEYIGDGIVTPIDGGYIWIIRGFPFAQRMSDPDDSIRRIYLNIQVEFITKT